jgi:phytol kinase
MLAIAYVMTLSILAIACHCFDPSHLTIALPVALAATLCEAISPGGTDNLTVPIGSALLCYGLDLLM